MKQVFFSLNAHRQVLGFQFSAKSPLTVNSLRIAFLCAQTLSCEYAGKRTDLAYGYPLASVSLLGIPLHEACHTSFEPPVSWGASHLRQTTEFQLINITPHMKTDSLSM